MEKCRTSKRTMLKEVLCDFIVWTPKDIVIQSIPIDELFLQTKLVELQHFFVNAILPEIIGKWYSKKPITDLKGIVSEPCSNNSISTSATLDEESEDYTRSWCYCNKPSYGDMILCDNKSCTIQWFHFDCLSIRGPPKSKWYCPSCRKLSKFNRKKKFYNLNE